MAPQEFEFIFVTDRLTDADDPRVDALLDALPGASISSPEHFTLVTCSQAGVTAVDAGMRALRVIEQCGLEVQRTYQDLVTRQEIADRADVSRQSVGQWVRGERHSDDDGFPAHVSLVAGGAWLWGDVADWLRDHVASYQDNLQYPTLCDHAQLDTLILSGKNGGSAFVTQRVSTGAVLFASQNYDSTPDPASYKHQRDYALSA